MRLEDFDYSLPPESIAQHPAARRDAARLLRMDRASGRLSDHVFRELPELLRAGDLLVLNDSRVFPARLIGRRRGIHASPAPGPRNPARREFLGGPVEILLVRECEDAGSGAPEWNALARPGGKLPVGESLIFEATDGGSKIALAAEIIARGEFGERRLRFSDPGGAPLARAEFFARLDQLGRAPLPPYIHRSRRAPEAREDRERYQTIYAREPGSVAAPTAGLHFTPEVFAALAAAGVLTATLRLDVGLGTFQPVRTPEIERHRMHSERYFIPEAAAAAVAAARAQGRRVIAVGTTAARTLEAAAGAGSGRVEAGPGETDLFLYPGRPPRLIDGLLTNFHAPRSTLLMLVASFVGREPILAAYYHALAAGYRFLSYGDCMLIA